MPNTLEHYRQVEAKVAAFADGTIEAGLERVRGFNWQTASDAAYAEGIVYWANGYLKAAAEAFVRALRADPESPLARVGFAMLVLTGEEQTAELARLDSEWPEVARVQLCLGALIQMNGDFDGAIARYRRALELLPGSPTALLSLGIALREKGAADEAAQQARELSRVLPSSPSFQAKGIRLLYSLGHHREARKMAKEVEIRLGIRGFARALPFASLSPSKQRRVSGLTVIAIVCAAAIYFALLLATRDPWSLAGELLVALEVCLFLLMLVLDGMSGRSRLARNMRELKAFQRELARGDAYQD